LKMMRLLLAISAIFAMLAMPAIADVHYKATVEDVAGAPLKLISCEAWARDWNKTFLTAHVASLNALFDFGVSVQNVSAQPVTAFRIAATSFDAYGAVLAPGHVDTATNETARMMNLAPGATLELLGPKGWHGRNEHPDRDHLTCSISSVHFADGTVWSAPTPSSSAPVSAPSQRARRRA
jgi:hypothetical protein